MDAKAKEQICFADKEIGIFFINDDKFCKYFSYIKICYILFLATSVKYPLKGENKNNNGIVFNIVTEKDVSILRKNWRIDRTIKNKILPNHISLAKYDSISTKYFSNYNDNFESYSNWAINASIEKMLYI